MWEKKYKEWLNNKNLDSELRVNMSLLSKEELEECFHKNIDFGTAGMRGQMNVGTNAINIHTITRATIGLAKYILDSNTEHKLVVIAYDSRINSKLFAICAAKVLASFDIRVNIFKEIAPTPVASFAIRDLGACNGIVITASHNPKTDNGFKVYNRYGSQLNLEESQLLTNNVNNTENYLDFEFDDSKKELISFVNQEVINNYHSHLVNIKVNESDLTNSKFVFTPLFGTSWKYIQRASEFRGMNFTEVKSQVEEDGNFPGLVYPNPEEKSSFDLGIDIAKLIKADAVFATDPDADRLGLAVLHGEEYVFLNGNEQGILAAVYLLNSKTLKNEINDKSLILSSIVSTHLVDKIANAYGCDIEHVLTGFKFIGEKIQSYDTNRTKEFVFGFEESYGCLVKDFSRDKDALQATMLFAEMVSFYKNENMSLVDVLDLIYQKFGYSKTKVLSYSFHGSQGQEIMNTIMTKFRNVPQISIGDININKKTDYLNDQTNLPKTDMIEYKTSDEDKFIYLRPSGTEPKLKIYVEIINENEKHAQEEIDQIQSVFDRLIGNVNENL